MVERLDLARYVIIAGSVVACFMNLTGEIQEGAGLLQIAFYSGTLLLFVCILIFIENKYVLAGILCLAGYLMILGNMEAGEISPGIIMIGYSTYIIDKKFFNYIIYLTIGMIITAIHVFNSCSPEDLVNILNGYAVLFALNEIIYKKRQSHVKDGG